MKGSIHSSLWSKIDVSRLSKIEPKGPSLTKATILFPDFIPNFDLQRGNSIEVCFSCAIFVFVDFQICGMLPPIRAPSVGACGQILVFGLSHGLLFKIRPAHTIIPSLTLYPRSQTFFFLSSTLKRFNQH